MSLRTRLNIHHPLLTGPGNNLWKSARIFCKIAIKGCRNLQTLHSIPSSYFSIPCSPFPRVFFLRFDFIRLTPSVLRETLSRYPSSQHSASSDIPCFFTLPLPEFPSFSSTPVVPFSTLFPPFVLYSFFLFLPEHSSFFTSSFHSSPPMFTIRKISTTFNISYLWSFLLFNTHTSFFDRRPPPGSPDISPSILGVRKGQVPPQQVSCLPASKGVAWISYSWRGPAELIYLSRRGN